jgi:hypothetical protein
MRFTWDEFQDFESRDLISKYMFAKHGRKPNAQKIKEVASNFTQGREYFNSSKTANITVKPLLLFYGVMSLSRGLILFNDLGLRETQLKGSHGLEILNWRKVIESKNFEELTFKINKGTFSELINTTKNSSLFRADSKSINLKIGYGVPKENCEISLKQLMVNFPDLDREYENWIGEKYVKIKYRHQDSEYDGVSNYFHYSKREENFELENIFPSNLCNELELNSYIDSVAICYKGTFHPTLVQQLDIKFGGVGGVGKTFLIPTVNLDFRISMLGALYMASYCLGMMARYYPTAWISLGRSEKGDRIFPLINRLLNIISEFYPKLILDHLNEYKIDLKTGVS